MPLLLLPFESDFLMPEDPGPSSGLSGAFGFFFVVVVLVGILTTIWKVSTARRMAEKSGMDPDDATAMTLLSDDGLEATYLASNLRAGPAAPTPPAGSPTAGTAADRLRELKDLLDQGLITQEEHDARRKAVIDSV